MKQPDEPIGRAAQSLYSGSLPVWVGFLVRVGFFFFPFPPPLPLPTVCRGGERRWDWQGRYSPASLEKTRGESAFALMDAWWGPAPLWSRRRGARLLLLLLTVRLGSGWVWWGYPHHTGLPHPPAGSRLPEHHAPGWAREWLMDGLGEEGGKGRATSRRNLTRTGTGVPRATPAGGCGGSRHQQSKTSAASHLLSGRVGESGLSSVPG